jgi:hypothetical protein
MVSTFNLPPGTGLPGFSERYARFVAALRDEDLLVASSGVGRRVTDTPMDTDSGNPRCHATLITFRDRTQLDAAYARLTRDTAAHHGVQALVAAGLFSCWDMKDDD